MDNETGTANVTGDNIQKEDFGLDVPRVWATESSVISNGDEFIIVFKESFGKGENGDAMYSRNVSSVVLSAEAAFGLASAIANIFSKIDEDQPNEEINDIADGGE